MNKNINKANGQIFLKVFFKIEQLPKPIPLKPVIKPMPQQTVIQKPIPIL